LLNPINLWKRIDSSPRHTTEDPYILTKQPHETDERSQFSRGLDLFNDGQFFAAHEILEDLWRATPPEGTGDAVSSSDSLRRRMQGMVQLAVAFHHVSTGNLVGARSVLERALRNLHGSEASFPDLDLDQLRVELTRWQEYLDESTTSIKEPDESHPIAPALPKIMLRRAC
jgi:uncharacterized protein